MPRRMARSAETRFATLCAEAGAIANEPKEDASGWDFVVDLPRATIRGLPADLQAPPPSVLVQVKSHEGASRKIVLKLSNALAFAHSPLPCFVILMILPDAGPPAIYAVHFWEALIARTFKRAREAARDGIPNERLHKLQLTLKVSESDRHDDDLIEWMSTTVGSVGHDYAAAKRILQESVGYGEDRIGGTFQIGPLDSIEDLIDHQLGLTPSIPMAKITLHNRRFGIETVLPIPDGPISHARLISNPADTCVIRLRGPDGVEFSLDGDVIVPATPVPDEQFKARFRAPILDIIWAWGGESRIDGRIDTAAMLSPDLLHKMARLAGWAGQGPIDIRVDARNQRIMGSEGRIAGFPESDRWAVLAELIAPIAEIASVRTDDPPLLTIEQLLDAEGLEPFHRFMTQTDMTANAVLKPGASIPPVDHGVAACLIGVGDWVFGALVRQPISEQEVDGDRWIVRFGRPQLLARYVFRADEPGPLEALRADYKHQATRQGALALDNALLSLNDAQGD